MGRLVTFIGCLLAACEQPKVTQPPEIDAAPDGPGPDAPAPCPTEEFDEAVLGAQWSVLTGATPTYTIDMSRMVVTDAPFAPTPSMPATSWIYDLDVDKGNQMAWAFAIGGEDFTVNAQLAWTSTNAELTLGGIAVSDAIGTIAAYAGVVDGSTTLPGGVRTRIRNGPGADLAYAGTNVATGTTEVRIERRAGMARIYVDGVNRLSGPLPDLISNVTMFFVRHRNANGNFAFGTIEVRQLWICL